MTTTESPHWAARMRLLAAGLLMAASALVACPVQAGSGWSNATPVSPVNQPDPRGGSQLSEVAVNASGLAVAAWDQLDYTHGGSASIGAAVQTGGRWGKPFTVSVGPGWAMTPRVAAGDDGTLAVSWVHQDSSLLPNPKHRVQVAVRAPGTTTWTLTTLDEHAPGGVQLTQAAPVAVDAQGTVTVAWSLWDGTRNRVQASTLLRGGAWGPAVDIAPGDSALFPALAINERGDAALVFAVSPFAGYAMTSHAKYAFRAGAAGAWSAPVQVSETIPYSVGYVSAPRVGLDAQGLATVIYAAYGIEAVRQHATGWTAPRTVMTAPSAGSSIMTLELVLDQAGSATLAASIFDASTNVQRASVWVAQGQADGTWTPQTRLTDPTVPVDAYAGRAAVSRDGTLTLVGWIDHYHRAVQVARWMGNAWRTTTVGRGTAFSAFQEVLSIGIGSGATARMVWKNAKSGTQTMAVSFGN